LLKARIASALQAQFEFVMFWDALAVLLARVFLGVTWRGFRHTLEQVVFLSAIQQHQQEG